MSLDKFIRKITFGTLGMFMYSCSGNAIENNPIRQIDKDGYSAIDSTYIPDSKNSLDGNDSKNDSQTNLDVFDNKDDGKTNFDIINSDITDITDIHSIDDNELDIPKDDGSIDITDTNQDKDDGTIIPPKKNVSIYIEDVVSGKEINDLTFVIKDLSGTIITTGKGKNAMLELDVGKYIISITDNPTKAKTFEYNTGKKLTLFGDYYIDFNGLLDKMDNEGFSTEVKNATILAFNKTVIGSYFDLEFNINVTKDIEFKKQLIPNFDLDVPYLLENGAVNVENAFGFVTKYLELAPTFEGGYIRPLQWNTAPNPVTLYIDEKLSIDGKINYKQAALAAKDEWEQKAGMQLYTLVNFPENAQITLKFDGTTKSITKHNFDTTNEQWILLSAKIEISPKSTFQEVKNTSAHELYHVNASTPSEGNIEGTTGKDPQLGFLSISEGKAIAIQYNASLSFSTVDMITK